MHASKPLRPETLESCSLRRRLEKSSNPRDRFRSRIPAVSQIEDKTRIPDGIPSEAGRCCVISAQEFFHFSEQIHLSFSL
jgi:hypothetical protein